MTVLFTEPAADASGSAASGTAAAAPGPLPPEPPGAISFDSLAVWDALQGVLTAAGPAALAYARACRAGTVATLSHLPPIG